MADFHWVGSTAANINSLRWGNTSNWRVIKNGVPGSTAPGGTLATLIPASRTPLSGDRVWIGTPPYLSNTASLYSPRRYHVYSPCLFGGVSTDTNRMWEGATAGTSLYGKYGFLTELVVSPQYPFSRAGGYVDLAILQEWTNHINSMFGKTFSGWTLSSGTEYDNASYATIDGWIGTSFPGGISFGSQSSYTLRLRGNVTNASHSRTTTTITGLTGASGGATGQAYDGSYNQVFVTVYPPQARYNFNDPNSANSPTNGWTGQAFTTNTIGQVVYDSGETNIFGNWNSVLLETSTENATVNLSEAKVNSFTIDPMEKIYWAGITMAIETPVSSANDSLFGLGNIYIDETSSLRYFQISKVAGICAAPDGGPGSQVVVLGDITSTGGFSCLAPAGPSAGVCGGVQYTNGSLVIDSVLSSSYATYEPRVVLGFAQYDGSTKSTTSIDKVYFLSSNPGANRVVIDGPIQCGSMYLHGGTLEKGSGLQTSANVVIDNLYLFGSSVYDQSTNSSHYNTTAKIRVMSNSASVKPGAKTTLDVGHVDNN